MKLNKAAMFGLDARIALAIFGALSVISGAALYSAIQHSKIVALITDLNEIGKSYEQYVLDTGLDLSINSQNIYVKTSDLVVDNGVKGWNGPYTSLQIKSGIDHVLEHKDVGSIFLVHALDENWPAYTSGVAFVEDVKCVSGKLCMVYSGYENISKDLTDAIELEIDGVINYQQGSVRAMPMTGNYHVYIKQRPVLKQL